jgi:hypothetical protein
MKYGVEDLLKKMEEEIMKRLKERYNLMEASHYKEVRGRGRPAKKVYIVEKREKGARGRPAKMEKPERGYVGEDLIMRLIMAAQLEMEMN